MSAPPKPRQRESVFLIARIVRPDGGATQHRVRNLSRDGICIEQPGELAMAARLVVSIGQVENVQAEVVWARDTLAGLKFLRRIDTARARTRPAKSLDPKAGWGR